MDSRQLLDPIESMATAVTTYSISVLPNLCAAAHKCDARAVEVCRGRMSEIRFSMGSFIEVFNCH